MRSPTWEETVVTLTVFGICLLFAYISGILVVHSTSELGREMFSKKALFLLRGFFAINILGVGLSALYGISFLF